MKANIFREVLDRHGRPRSYAQLANIFLQAARHTKNKVRASFLLAWAIRYAKQGNISISQRRIKNVGEVFQEILQAENSNLQSFLDLSSYAHEPDATFVLHPLGDHWYTINVIGYSETRAINISRQVYNLLFVYNTLAFHRYKTIGKGVVADVIQVVDDDWRYNIAEELEFTLQIILNAPQLRVIELQ